MNKIYKHHGPGHYIGSYIIVVAKSLEQASQLIRKELDNCGLKDEELNIEEIKIKEGTIVHSADGDY